MNCVQLHGSRGFQAVRRTVLALFLIAHGLSLQPATAAEESASEQANEGVAAGEMDEVVACVRGNAPRETMVQKAEITTLDGTGADRSLNATLYWKRDKKRLSRIFLRVEAPTDLRDAAFLMIERADRPADMWMYLPELRKVRRISARTISGSLFGTDFSYEDIQHLQPEFNGDRGQRLADAEVDGRAVYVVAVSMDEELESSYSRIVSYIDREYCVPLKMEFYEDSDLLRKVMTIDPKQVLREASTWVPRSIVLRDLDRETESRFVVAEVEIDSGIPDRRFTQGQLQKGR